MTQKQGPLYCTCVEQDSVVSSGWRLVLSSRKADTLTRVGFIWLHDSNSMVRKLEMRSRQLELWHVAGHALVLRCRTGFRPGFSPCVAGQAFRVVFDGFSLHLVMRIVACQAANPLVVHIVALAASQAVWLETNVRYARVRLHNNFCPRPVALSTKIRNLLGGESA